MASITIRDLPDDVVEGLKRQASQHGRSMEAEVRELLTLHVLDRRLVMDIIEQRRGGLRRSTSAEEVDAWLSRTRERSA